MQAAEDLNGVRGKLFRADVDKRKVELLKETVFDPKTDEGKSRHTVYWTEDTRFIRVDHQNSFEGLEGKYRAQIRPLQKETAAEEAKGKKTFVTLNVVIFAKGEGLEDRIEDDGDIVASFTPDPKSDRFRGGTVEIEGKTIPVRLRGPRAKIDIRSAAEEYLLGEGFWETQIFGARDDDGRFIADRIDLYPLSDPRKLDDPELPRVLVVGDSISMNYHKSAKEALEGIANYHRAQGNCGPSDRGVVCMELWLGDYEQKGLQWDIIQFNHGLHDLKQFYDEKTGEYGAHQVELDEYKKNLEKEIAIMHKTGATLMWCSTTPVPTSYSGRWGDNVMGRRKGEDLIYNKAALEVMAKHPDILINDLNAVIRKSESDLFDKWWQGRDVHFWNGEQQKIVGDAVAEAIKRALKVRAEEQR